MKRQYFVYIIRTMLLLVAINTTLSFAQPYEQMKATIYALTTTGYSLADGNSCVFDVTFSNNIDNNDVTKQSNFGENFGILRDTVTLAIEARKNVITVDTVYYRLWNLRQATTYKLEFTPRFFKTPGLMAFLHDNFLNADSPISLIDTTRVTFAVTSAAGSFAQNRFKLYLKVSTLPLHFAAYNAVETPGGINVNWTMAGGTSYAGFEIEHAVDGIRFSKKGAIAKPAESNTTSPFAWTDYSPAKGVNFYRIKAITASGRPIYSGIMKVSLNKNSRMSISQNPVQGQTIQLVFTGQVQGRYEGRIINPQGQVLKSFTINHSGGSGNYSIHAVGFAAGLYRLNLLSPLGEHVVMPVMMDVK